MAGLYDMLVIGGGINGCGIARDAAGRGLSVLLAEQGDLGGATSSASTKLIHGGLRYLETYQFRLVWEALHERAVLLKMAPHLVAPLRFILPHEPHLRPRWMLRLGLLAYDLLAWEPKGRRALPRSRAIDLAHDPSGAALQPHLTHGYAYADARVDDARLVILNAVSAREKGARILTRTALLAARREGGLWHAVLQTPAGQRTVQARTLVLAAGPWLAEVQQKVAGLKPEGRLRLVRGSHIVVRRRVGDGSAYIFQTQDGRVVFAIPYQRDFTLIGTTDEPVARPDDAAISDGETAYLCAAASRYLRMAVTPADVVWTYAGIRSLYDDGRKEARRVTRDYVLELDEADGAPCLSVYGGKITTYRRLAEAVLRRLRRHLPQMGPPWTSHEVLPGGDTGEFSAFVAALSAAYPALDPAWLLAAAQRHGTRLHRVLEHGPGRDFGGGLYEAEARWFRREEWARTADDILWRRTKSGLHMSAAERAAFAAWMQQGATPHPSTGSG
jgi:glycerol-3-phosphate dehydrogenase